MAKHRPPAGGGSYDVALVGSGMASTFTAIRLIERLLANPTPTLARMAIFERSGDFFGGLAYGKRSGQRALILSTLGGFLPPAERRSFIAWLAANSGWILAELQRTAGVRSAAWLERARSDLSSGRSTDLYIPRYLWGVYIGRQLRQLAERATARGLLRLDLLAAEVRRLRPSRCGYEIRSGAGRFETRAAVLALGSAPTRRLFDDERAGALLIDDIYEPSLEVSLARIARRLGAAADPPELLVIGANASCLEMLYELTNLPALADSDARIWVLAPQGRLPERYAAKSSASFVPTHLPRLAGRKVTAAGILDAVKLDLEEARGAGLPIADSLPPISAGVNQLLESLSNEEAAAFANGPGQEIGRLQRRGGVEVCEAADDLASAGRLHVVAGRYVGLERHDGATADVRYRDPAGALRTLEQRFAALVNCSGSAGMERPNRSALIESLLAEGTCKATPGGHGFRVDDHLEARPGLFVNGPLLAGNVLRGRPVWHVEHCGRILQFSELLAGELEAALRPATAVERDVASPSPDWAGAVTARTPAWKRAFDLVVAALGLVVLGPLLAAVALLVLWKLGRPILYTQERAGLAGAAFRLHKFRSMANADADADGRKLTDAERLTPFGAWLRRTSLDELPELVSVLKGEMSIVGPRPLPLTYLPLYSSAQMRRHAVRPGLTGLAQVNGRNAISWREKFSFDLRYVDELSPLLDLRVLLRTIGAVVRGTGVHATEMSAGMEPFTGAD